MTFSQLVMQSDGGCTEKRLPAFRTNRSMTPASARPTGRHFFFANIGAPDFAAVHFHDLMICSQPSA
jgi:hypothetical protein